MITIFSIYHYLFITGKALNTYKDILFDLNKENLILKKMLSSILKEKRGSNHHHEHHQLSLSNLCIDDIQKELLNISTDDDKDNNNNGNIVDDDDSHDIINSDNNNDSSNHNNNDVSVHDYYNDNINNGDDGLSRTLLINIDDIKRSNSNDDNNNNNTNIDDDEYINFSLVNYNNIKCEHNKEMMLENDNNHSKSYSIDNNNDDKDDNYDSVHFDSLTDLSISSTLPSLPEEYDNNKRAYQRNSHNYTTNTTEKGTKVLYSPYDNTVPPIYDITMRQHITNKSRGGRSSPSRRKSSESDSSPSRRKVESSGSSPSRMKASSITMEEKSPIRKKEKRLKKKQQNILLQAELIMNRINDDKIFNHNKDDNDHVVHNNYDNLDLLSIDRKKDSYDNNDTIIVVNYDDITQHQQTYLPKLNTKNNTLHQRNSPQNSPNNPKVTTIKINPWNDVNHVDYNSSRSRIQNKNIQNNNNHSPRLLYKIMNQNNNDDDTVSSLYHIPPIKIFPTENNKVKLSKSELVAMNVRKNHQHLYH